MNICIITSSFPSRPDDIVQAPFLIDFIIGLKKTGASGLCLYPGSRGRKGRIFKRCKGQMVSLDQIEETPCPAQSF